MLYLKEDVTLAYSINPLYSYTLPAYTWKAGLKITKIKVDFIKDKELLLLLEKNYPWRYFKCNGTALH